MLLNTGELLVPSTRCRRAWLPRVSMSQGLQPCQALVTMVISGIMVGRSLAPVQETAGQALLMFQLLCSFLAPVSSRHLDPDRLKTQDTAFVVALTAVSDAATLVMVAGLAIQTLWPVHHGLVLLAIPVCTIATVLTHQAALRQLPKTFTEGEAWLCVVLAVSGLLWLASALFTAVLAHGGGTNHTAAAAATRLLQLDTIPVLVATTTTLFCCCAARPLQAAVRQLAPPPANSLLESKDKLLQRAAHAPSSPPNGSIPPWPAAPTERGQTPRSAGAAHHCKAALLHPPPRGAQPAHSHSVLPTKLLLTIAAYAAVMAACAVRTVRYVAAAPHRIATVGLWGAALAVAVPCMLLIARRGRVPHHILRKGFHVLCLALFIPVLLTDPPLLSLALAVAFVLLALAELLRTAHIPHISAALTSSMTRFTDSRDEGSFLVSHLSLLLGIAVPVWVALAGRSHAPDEPAPLTAWTGLIALGLADTVAATVGLLCGRLRVHQTSKKTAEGLLAATAATVGALGAAAAWQGQAAGALWWLQLVWVSLLACMLEAATLQLDNLVFAWQAFALLSLLG